MADQERLTAEEIIRKDEQKPMVEQCGCTPRLDPIPFDADGDGIGEECRRCGEYIALVPVS